VWILLPKKKCAASRVNASEGSSIGCRCSGGGGHGFCLFFYVTDGPYTLADVIGDFNIGDIVVKGVNL
jgi:hypothetical protein